MEDLLKQTLWNNFAASIDMLKEIIKLSPDEGWKAEGKFYYTTYHTLIFLDYYLTFPVKNFRPALPYTLTESDALPKYAIDDVIPSNHYSKEDMVNALTQIREKCRKLTVLSTYESLGKKWIEKSEIEMHGLCPPFLSEYTVLEILFYNLRHIEHHVGQLNYILKEKYNRSANWISQAN